MFYNFWNIKKCFIIFGIAFLLFVFIVGLGPEIYYQIRGFQYINPQPDYLVTIRHSQVGDNLVLILEADTLFLYGCDNYKFSASTDWISDDAVVIYVSGLYKKGSMYCITRGHLKRRRPLAEEPFGVDIGPIPEKPLNLIFILEKEDRINKFVLTETEEGIEITPKNNSFISFIAFIDSEGELVKYSEKYINWLQHGIGIFYEKEEFQGKSYFSY